MQPQFPLNFCFQLLHATEAIKTNIPVGISYNTWKDSKKQSVTIFLKWYEI